METVRRGNAAEAAVLKALTDLGLKVLIPFGGGHPYDLVVHLEPGGFLRIQCKCARQYRRCALFNSRTTDHGSGRLPYIGRADAFGVFLPDNNQVYLVPVREATTFTVGLRLEPTRNNQRKGVKLAADYEVEHWSISALAGLIQG
jgi:hypothetical protein